MQKYVLSELDSGQRVVTERGKALGLTLGAVAFVVAAVLVIAVIPADHLLWLVQWALLGVGLTLSGVSCMLWVS